MSQIHALRSAYSTYSSQARRGGLSLVLASALLIQGMIGFGQLAAPAAAFAAGRTVNVATAAELISAVRDLQDGDTVVLAAGTYDVERQLGDMNMGGQTGWYFPIWKNDVTVRGAGVGQTTLTSSVDSPNGAWASQDFISVWANGVTIEGMTVVSKNQTNKAIEIMGKDCTLRGLEFLTNPLQSDAGEFYEFSGSVYFNPMASVTGAAGDVGASRMEDVFIESAWVSAPLAVVTTGTIDLSGVTLDWVEGGYAPYNGYGMMSSNPCFRVEQDVTFVVDNTMYSIATQASARLPIGAALQYEGPVGPSDEVTSSVFTSLKRGGSYPASGTVGFAYGDPMRYAWTFPIGTLDPSFDATFFPGIAVRTTLDTAVGDMFASAELPASGHDVVEVSLAHEGALPGLAQLELLTDPELAGKTFELFTFGPEVGGGPLASAGQTVIVDEDGYVTIDVDTGDVWYLVEVPAEVAFIRHAGANRYDTAIKAAEEAFPEGADAAILACAKDFPDAIAASTLAGVIDGPILLTDTAVLTPQTAAELNALGVETVYIAGGPNAVSNAIQSDLDDTYDVVRLAGRSRYETAKAIADEAVRLGASDTEAFLVRGDDFADALAVASIATQRQVPVLLTFSGALAPSAASFIESNSVGDVYVAGGTNAVSNATANSVTSLGSAVTRWSGGNRYATAATVVGEAVALWDMDVTHIGLSSGANFPDAVAGGAAMGAKSGFLLLTDPKALSPEAETLISGNTATIVQVEFFGGVNALAADVSDAVMDLFAE